MEKGVRVDIEDFLIMPEGAQPQTTQESVADAVTSQRVVKAETGAAQPRVAASFLWVGCCARLAVAAPGLPPVKRCRRMPSRTSSINICYFFSRNVDVTHFRLASGLGHLPTPEASVAGCNCPLPSVASFREEVGGLVSASEGRVRVCVVIYD